MKTKNGKTYVYLVKNLLGMELGCFNLRYRAKRFCNGKSGQSLRIFRLEVI